MSKVYYKAVRPDGTDFYSGTIDYAAAVGGRVRAPGAAHSRGYQCCSGDVLHAGLTPTDVWAGTSWPLRLFEVTGRPVAERGRKLGFRSLAVVREIEPWRAFGPQGEQISALIDRARLITPSEARSLDAARGAARGAALDAALDAAWDAALDAAWDAAWDAALGAAWDAALGAALDAASALAVRDLIGGGQFLQEHYDRLVLPWAKVIGPVHPGDAPAS